MRLGFVGADHEVTGSCHYLEACGKHILVDCGLEQGKDIYVNQDIPVLAILEDGEAVLVTGFNEFNVVIMEPATGKLYKKGMNDATAWFAENGNHFITYMRTEN